MLHGGGHLLQTITEKRELETCGRALQHNARHKQPSDGMELSLREPIAAALLNLGSPFQSAKLVGVTSCASAVDQQINLEVRVRMRVGARASSNVQFVLPMCWVYDGLV